MTFGLLAARGTTRRERMVTLVTLGAERRWCRVAVPMRPVAPVRMICMIRLGMEVQGLDIGLGVGVFEVVSFGRREGRISIVQ